MLVRHVFWFLSVRAFWVRESFALFFIFLNSLSMVTQFTLALLFPWRALVWLLR